MESVLVVGLAIALAIFVAIFFLSPLIGVLTLVAIVRRAEQRSRRPIKLSKAQLQKLNENAPPWARMLVNVNRARLRPKKPIQFTVRFMLLLMTGVALFFSLRPLWGLLPIIIMIACIRFWWWFVFGSNEHK